MILDTTTRKLQIVLTAAKTTLDLPVVVDYVDMTATATTGGMYPSFTNGVTVVDILPVPPASTQRKVNSISIYNKDTAAKTVQVSLLDGATSYAIIDMLLQVDDTLGYTDTQGWYTLDAQGNLKSVQAASANSIANAISTSTEKTTPVAADKVGIVDSVTGLLNWSSFTDLLNWFAAKAGNAANVFSVATATAAAHAVRKDQFDAGVSGSVIQTITAFYSTLVSTTSATLVDTGLSATITPKYATSKILVIVSQAVTMTPASSASFSMFAVLRGASNNIFQNNREGGFAPTGSNYLHSTPSCSILDSPATTSAITYKTQFASSTAGQAVEAQHANMRTSTITLMEIAQ